MPFSSSDLLAALPRLRRYARLLTDDPAAADDIVERTLSRARHVLNEPALGTTPEMQLLSVLRSEYADHAAYRRPREPMPPRHTGELDRSNAGRIGVLPQLFQLPIEQREVLVLVAVERMSYQDVATLLAVPVATVLARLMQAREALRSVASEPLAAPKNAG